MVMPLPYRTLAAAEENLPSSGAELVTVDGRSLPLVGARLVAEAGGGLARSVLEQRFENRYAETLRVRYRMPLPADGAVSAYEFELGGRVIAGRVQRKAEAREQFEQAIAAGQTAALLEQDRDDIFTQELGNILPGEAIVARITIDQRLVWLAGTSGLGGGDRGDGPFEGEWELRLPTVIGPRYVGAADSADDARATHVAVAPGQIGARISIELAIRDAIVPGRAPSSPSHELRSERGGRVALRARDGARLDRDIVVRWPVAAPAIGVSLEAARGEGEAAAMHGLLTIVPPAPSARAGAVPRDLTVLLDTSGSMGGAPLDAAKAVVALVIESLGEGDRLELIEFSDRPRRYRGAPVAATAAARRDAIAWVRSRQASGGTEMASGVREALRELREGAQRQVIVVTDGYVGGERQIVELLHGNLPGSCRLHVLGVGAAVNRSLAAALARAGRGVEVIAGIAGGAGRGRGHDDFERAAARLIAHTRAPVLVDVELSGSALLEQAPARIPDVFAGAPVVAALALRPEGGELVVRGALAQGAWEQRLAVPARRPGEGSGAIAKLFARERVADLEARSAVGEWGSEREEIDRQIEELGLAFQISTRLTSWVAIDERRRAEAGPGRTEDMPQELPYGTSAASFGLRGGVEGFGEVEMVSDALMMNAFAGPTASASVSAATPAFAPAPAPRPVLAQPAPQPVAAKPAGPAEKMKAKLTPDDGRQDRKVRFRKEIGPQDQKAMAGKVSAPAKMPYPSQPASSPASSPSSSLPPELLSRAGAPKAARSLRRWLLLALLLALIAALTWWLVL
jgi:Ca-activated chloride channel family protein